MLTFGDHGFGLHGAGQYLGPARWPWFDLLWVFTGSVALRAMNSRELTLVGGSGTLIFPQTEFVGESLTANCRVSVQHFGIGNGNLGYSRSLERLRHQECGLEVYQARTFDIVEQDIERAVNLSLQASSPATDSEREAITLMILAQLEQRIVEEPVFRPQRIALDRLCDWLTRQLHRDLSVGDMANFVALSPSHFRTVFRSEFRTSPAKYFHDLRMAEAARLLRQTNRPIKTIAVDIGQPDLPNFYREFRRYAGMAPARYRKTHTATG